VQPAFPESEKWEIYKRRLVRLLKGISLKEKKAINSKIKDAVKVLQIHEAFMSEAAPSAELVQVRKKLSSAVQDAKDEGKPQGMRAAFDKMSRQERCTANFAKLYKSSFEPQFITEMHITPDWSHPDTHATASDGSPLKAESTDAILTEATTYYKYLFDEKETTEAGRQLAYSLLRKPSSLHRKPPQQEPTSLSMR